MAFFISYPLSVLGHDISIGSQDDIGTRADKEYDMKNDMFIIYFNRGNN
jgi:hypothetical protein